MTTKQTLMIGGGIAFGAIATVGTMTALRPDDQKETSSPTSKAPESEKAAYVENAAGASDSDSIEGKTKTRDIVDEIAKNASEIDIEGFEGQEEEFRKTLRERQMETLNNKIAKWGAGLGLDDQQKETLLDISASQIKELETLAEGAEGADPAVLAESAKRAMSIMSGRALEDAMGGILTDEQKSKYEAFGSRQLGARAEGRSLRQLATLQEELMLSPEQRDSAYGIIYENNLKQLEGNSDVSAMIDQFSSQSGVTLDPSMQGILSTMATRGLAEMAKGGDFNAESVQALAAETMNDSINQQVEQLRPVLTAPQLELYRSQLEGRLENLGNIIPGNDGN